MLLNNIDSDIYSYTTQNTDIIDSFFRTFILSNNHLGRFLPNCSFTNTKYYKNTDTLDDALNTILYIFLFLLEYRVMRGAKPRACGYFT